MAEEYEEEVVDFKKIAIVAGLIIGGVIALVVFLTGAFIVIPIPEDEQIKTIFDTPEEIKPIQQQNDIQKIQEQRKILESFEPTEQIPVKSNYEKFIEQGISRDDVVNIQEMDCTLFGNATEYLSPNEKFQEIFEQRLSECT